ncbi:MAG: hypothetical protein HC866_24840 [Leptolyngbyaceae cyanobacterium RU_5_1]|nr:hypothetical protein [Leptolyngbyaceae cyanobacterium RU_5_1]
MQYMRFRVLAVSLLAGLLWMCSNWFTPAALALTQIRLFDLSYHDCPPELAKGMVASGGPQAANCFIVTGKAENTSGKPVVNADIFGRIYDANNNNVMENRGRLGSIEYVPPGTSDFELRVSIPVNQPTPLQLKQFKAAGFSGKVRR